MNSKFVRFGKDFYRVVSLFATPYTNDVFFLVDDEQGQRCFLRVNQYTLIDLIESKKQPMDLTRKALRCLSRSTWSI